MRQIYVYLTRNTDGIHIERSLVGSFIGDPFITLTSMIGDYFISKYESFVIAEQNHTSCEYMLEICSTTTIDTTTTDKVFELLAGGELEKAKILDDTDDSLRKEYYNFLNISREESHIIQSAIDYSEYVKIAKNPGIIMDLNATVDTFREKYNINTNPLAGLILSYIIYAYYNK